MAKLFSIGFFFAVFIALASSSSIQKREAEATTAAAATTTTTINICGNSSCPTFSVIKNLPDGVEERQYTTFETAAYTAVTCQGYSAALSRGYYHLSMYTRRARNVEGRPLKMGVPVLMEAKHVNDVDEECSWIYTTMFYLSGDEVAAPVDSKIRLEVLPDQRYYVYTFSGFETNYKHKVLELRQKLNAVEPQVCYESEKYYIAIYQSPKSYFNRRNEIWLPAKNC